MSEDKKNYVFDIDDQEKTFTLECLNNKQRPIEQQMRVKMQPISAKDADSIASRAMDEAGTDSKAKGWNDKYSKLWLQYTIEKKVKGMENIFFKINGQVKEIKDALELYALKDIKANIIFKEIKKLINLQDEINEDEEKN